MGPVWGGGRDSACHVYQALPRDSSGVFGRQLGVLSLQIMLFYYNVMKFQRKLTLTYMN